MSLKKSQLAIIALVFLASVSAWFIILKMFLDSSLEFKWSVFVWFFGACIVAALVLWSFEVTGAFSRKRHATLKEINKNNIEINNPIWSRDNAK